MSNSAGVDVQVTDSQETACELVLEQLKHADKVGINDNVNHGFGPWDRMCCVAVA